MEPNIGGLAYVLAALVTVAIPSGVTLILQLRSHRALTKNHHSSKKPTIPDQLSDIRAEISELNQLVLMHIMDHANIDNKEEK